MTEKFFVNRLPATLRFGIFGAVSGLLSGLVPAIPFLKTTAGFPASFNPELMISGIILQAEAAPLHAPLFFSLALIAGFWPGLEKKRQDAIFVFISVLFAWIVSINISFHTMIFLLFEDDVYLYYVATGGAGGVAGAAGALITALCLGWRQIRLRNRKAVFFITVLGAIIGACLFHLVHYEHSKLYAVLLIVWQSAIAAAVGYFSADKKA